MKKQFFIKNLSIVLILALCISFCSCGGSSSDDSASGEFSVDIVSDASIDGDASVDTSVGGGRSCVVGDPGADLLRWHHHHRRHRCDQGSY